MGSASSSQPPVPKPVKATSEKKAADPEPEPPLTIQAWPQTADEIFEGLKVISALQPKERFATQSEEGIYIQKPGVMGQWLTRWWYQESRNVNIRALDHIFAQAFRLADEALKEREGFPNKSDEKCNREELLAKLKNKQLLEKLQREIDSAKKGVHTLGETYSTDMKTKSKISLLDEKIHNRLEQIALSLQYLNSLEASAQAPLPVSQLRRRHHNE